MRAELGALDDLWDGDMVGRTSGDTRVLLVRYGDRVYAYENRCAHLGVALSEGTLEGHVLTCRAHQWQYDVRTGRGMNPRTACLRDFHARVEDGRIVIDLPEAGGGG